MQLTRLDRYLRERFVYETHVYTLRLPESIPAGTIAEELPDTPGRKFRHRFILITEDPREAERRGWSLRWWDFLFYLSFGLVITLSVEIGGVLMVFTYLVAPAIIALASSASWGRRIAIAWGVGLTGSAIGLIASYRWDFPTGPAVVCALGAILLLFALWRKLGRAGDRGAARAGGS